MSIGQDVSDAAAECVQFAHCVVKLMLSCRSENSDNMLGLALFELCGGDLEEMLVV